MRQKKGWIAGIAVIAVIALLFVGYNLYRYPAMFRSLSDNSLNDSQVEELREEITDIYGAPPKQVINLISLSLLKQKASESGINEVVIRPKNICVSFENTSYLQRQEVFDALEKFKNIAKLDVTHKLSVVFQQGGESMERMFACGWSAHLTPRCSVPAGILRPRSSP